MLPPIPMVTFASMALRLLDVEGFAMAFPSPTKASTLPSLSSLMEAICIFVLLQLLLFVFYHAWISFYNNEGRGVFSQMACKANLLVTSLPKTNKQTKNSFLFFCLLYLQILKIAKIEKFWLGKTHFTLRKARFFFQNFL